MHIEDFLHATRSHSHKVYGTMAAVDDSSLCVIFAPSHSTATTKTCYWKRGKPLEYSFEKTKVNLKREFMRCLRLKNEKKYQKV